MDNRIIYDMEETKKIGVIKNYYQIERELRYDFEHLDAFNEAIKALDIEDGDNYDELPENYQIYLDLSEEEIERKIRAAETELQSIFDEQDKYSMSHEKNLQILRETHLLEKELAQSINTSELENKELQDEILVLDSEIERNTVALNKYMQISSLNDIFHIWYAGPYGTITNFRLGNIPIKPIDSNEINAALGQAALLVDTIAGKLGYVFKSYTVLPMGSFARIGKLDLKKTIFPLHLDAAGYLLYPKWHFNQALIGFMTCIIELGEVSGERDPTLSMPYKILLSDSKIGDVSFTYGNDDESWTRAMKYMLSNIKWLVAWSTKHAQLQLPM